MVHVAPASLIHFAVPWKLIEPLGLSVTLPLLSSSRPLSVTEAVMLLVPSRTVVPVPLICPLDQASPPLSVTVPVVLSVPPVIFHWFVTTALPGPVSVPLCRFSVPTVSVLPAATVTVPPVICSVSTDTSPLADVVRFWKVPTTSAPPVTDEPSNSVNGGPNVVLFSTMDAPPLS